MHADGKSNLASVSKGNSGKVNCLMFSDVSVIKRNGFLKVQLSSQFAVFAV